jgi:hypothetical protein
MIKLKKLLKESKYAWDRKFGDPLPTFKDIVETHQNKPMKESYDPKIDIDQSWGVFFAGGSIGSGKSGYYLPERGGIQLRDTFDDASEAKKSARSSNSRLSPGEKKYYGMKYLVRNLDKERKHLKKL